MLITNYQELFKQFTAKDKNYTLENTMKYWQSVAASNKIESEILELAINRGFARLADGDVFPEKCPCCEVGGVATAFIHAVRDDMLAIKKQVVVATLDIYQEKFKNVISSQMRRISKENKQYIKWNRPPLSERVKLFKWVKTKWTGEQS